MGKKIGAGIVYVLLVFALISGCQSMFRVFGGGAAVEPDLSYMQKQAEVVSELFLDWKEPLFERREKMTLLAPSVVPYLVYGNQKVLYTESTKPFVSGDRGYVDVTVHTRARISGEQNDIFRVYTMSVYFVWDHVSGEYVVERIPLMLSISPPYKQIEQQMTSGHQMVANELEPILDLFMPSLLSGDLRNVQNMLTDNADIKPLGGEYSYISIDEIRVRDPSDARVANYAADVVLKVKDNELDQELYIQVYVWVKVIDGKFYVVRANI